MAGGARALLLPSLELRWSAPHQSSSKFWEKKGEKKNWVSCCSGSSFCSLLVRLVVLRVRACVCLRSACHATSDTEARNRGQLGQTGNFCSANALYIYSSSVWNWGAALRVRKLFDCRSISGFGSRETRRRWTSGARLCVCVLFFVFFNFWSGLLLWKYFIKICDFECVGVECHKSELWVETDVHTNLRRREGAPGSPFLHKCIFFFYKIRTFGWLKTHLFLFVALLLHLCCHVGWTVKLQIAETLHWAPCRQMWPLHPVRLQFTAQSSSEQLPDH